MTVAKDTTPPRLDELIGTTDAALRHGLMPWSLTNAIPRGELRRYKLPGNRSAFRRVELDARAGARKAGHKAACMESPPGVAP